MQPPAFTEDGVCFQCKGTFSLMKRRHHCRHCGQAFCGDCQKKTCSIPKFALENVRVCDPCYEIVNSELQQPQQTISSSESKAATPASSSSSIAPKENDSASAPNIAKPKVKNCKCHMPLCICPPDPVEQQERKSVTGSTKRSAPVAVEQKTGATDSTPSYMQQSSYTPKYNLSGNVNEECRNAVKAGDLDGVRQLVAAGADAVAWTDRQGMSLLHLACMFDHDEVCQFLISSGAQLTKTNPEGETPLDLAPPALAFRLKQ